MARTACLQSLDQIHDKTTPKEKGKKIRQSKSQYLNGMVAKMKQKRNANDRDHITGQFGSGGKSVNSLQTCRKMKIFSKKEFAVRLTRVVCRSEIRRDPSLGTWILPLGNSSMPHMKLLKARRGK